MEDSAEKKTFPDSSSLPFNLQEGESIVEEVRPDKFGFLVSRSMNGIAAAVVLGIVSGFIAYLFEGSAIAGVLLGILAFMVLLLVVLITPLISYGKFMYWITNHRVIGRRGFIGYTIDSMPLENVTDVLVNRTIMDRILGLSSLVIVPIGGGGGAFIQDAGSRNGIIEGVSNYFPALRPEKARHLQALIFHLRDARKGSTGRIL